MTAPEFRPLRHLPKLNVGGALQRYVDIAASSGIINRDNGDVIKRLEECRGIPMIKEAAQVLGPHSGWPLRRKREFSRMLSERRSRVDIDMGPRQGAPTRLGPDRPR